MSDVTPQQTEPARALPSSSRPPSPPLEYDRSGNHVTRGQFRILLLLMFINTVAIVGYVCVPGGTTWLRQTWKDIETKRAAKASEQRKTEAKQKRVADFQKALPALASTKLPAEAPLYTEDGVEAAALLASNNAYETVPLNQQGMAPDLWQAAVGRTGPPQTNELYRFGGFDSDTPSRRGTTLFLHERRNPAGDKRLLWCVIEAHQAASYAESGHAVATTRNLRVWLIDPGTAGQPLNVLRLVETEIDQRGEERAIVKRGSEPKTPQIFRFLAGVADAADATRASLPYQLNGASGAIVVRVLEGDRLLVEPSHGRVPARSGVGSQVRQTWTPSAPLTVRLTESGR